MIQDAEWVRHVFFYDKETGEFMWRNPPVARGRSMPGKPAGAHNEDGKLMLRLGGKVYAATHIAWLYETGGWPDRQVHFKDASLPAPGRYRFDNLHLVGNIGDAIDEALRESIGYNSETGEFVWKVLRRGVKPGKSAGTLKPINGRMWRYIRFNGVGYGAGRLAWFLHYGDWPKMRLEFKDGDAANTRIDNIIEGRFSHGTRQDDDLTPEERERRRKETFRRSDLKRHYGLTDVEFAAKLVEQNGCCMVCGRGETAMLRGRVRELAVDHDHETGVVRDLLCSECNKGLGDFGDDPVRLRAAADYIERHRAAKADIIFLSRRRG